MGNRLQRDVQHAMLGGVCAGFARQYDFDVMLTRVVAVLCAVATGGVFIALYLVAWIIMPREDTPASAGAAPGPWAPPATVSEEMRNATDRLVEAARVLADKTREAAEEIAEIARRGPATAPMHADPGVPPEAPDLPPTPGIPPTDAPVPPETPVPQTPPHVEIGHETPPMPPVSGDMPEGDGDQPPAPAPSTPPTQPPAS